MDFGFTEEQDLLRAEARKLLDTHCPLEQVRKIAATPEGFSRELWKQLAELGWTGLAIPEAYGGAGLAWLDLVVLLEETGRTLFPSPLVSSALAAQAILEAGSEEQRRRWLPGLADGSRIGTLAIVEAGGALAEDGIALRGQAVADGFTLDGEKPFVHDAARADLFVVAFRAPQGVSLAVIEGGAPGVTARDFQLIDRTKRQGTLALAGVRVGREALLGAPGAAWPAVERILDRAAVALAAEIAGAAARALEITVRYAKERVQFDSPIGRFQGVKHPLAEMHVDLESFSSLVYYAAWALDHAPDEAPRCASMAKAYASEAFARIGIDGVQLHGAVGYTDEYDIQLYLKRSKWARPAFGDADHHYERVCALGAR
jgi:alkylation response protein AidB-like acyl-CoA dehydrogenase